MWTACSKLWEKKNIPKILNISETWKLALFISYFLTIRISINFIYVQCGMSSWVLFVATTGIALTQIMLLIVANDESTIGFST